MRRLISLLLLCCLTTSPLLGAGLNLNYENANSEETGIKDGTANEDTIVDEYLDGEVNNFLRIPDSSWDGESEKVYITNWPSRQAMYGTVLVNLNSKYKKATYKPKFEDVSFIKERVVNGLGIPAVYTDSYDNPDVKVVDTSEKEESQATLDETRETKILGGDILTLIDEWDINKNEPYVLTKSREEDVEKGLAIQACFKALGVHKYSVYMKSKPHETYETMPVTKTPFVTMVSSNDIHVDCSKYYTEVYVSRSQPDIYWETAHNMGIVNTEYSETDSSAENKEYTTLGELAVYIKSFLYANGEPVMTSQEEEYLMAVYGRELPTYLPSHQLEAVKYLMARGIFDSETDFGKNVNGAELMMYLARAKDKDSRLTFKEISIDYDKDLVKSGYFPTEVVSTDVTMYNPTWTRPDKAATTYYDYMVKVTDKSKFRDAKGRTVDNLYVSSVYNSTSDYKLKDSEYLGIENGYYHFRIPTDVISNTEACQNGYITINSGAFTDTPGNIKLEYGGGWYTEFEEEQGIGVEGCLKSKRTPFSVEDGEEFIDTNIKLSAMNEDNLKVFLKKENKVTYTFETDNINLFRWYGEEITTDSNKECYYEEGNNGTKRVVINMEESSTSAAKIIKQKLTVVSTGGDKVKFPAYMNADDNVLVSRTFLNQYFGNCSITTMEDKKGVYEIRFGRECILVDVGNKRVISGQAIREFSKEDKSPLIVKYSDGETLIDYRCLQGIINDYLVLNDDETGVKAISATVKRSSNGFKPFKDTNIYPLLGQDTQTQARINDDGYMSLEACYNQSNFLLYTKATDSVTYTTLLVFKPKVEGFETSEEVKKELLRSYSIELGDAENCTMYRLCENDTVITGDNEGLYKKIELGNTIKYSKIDGYTYKIPNIDTWDFRAYYEGEDCKTSVLPIVYKDNMYIDLNANIDLNNGPYKFPGELLNPSVANKLNAVSGIQFSNGQGGGYWSTNVSMGDVKNGVQYAPIGVFLNFYTIEEKQTKDILGEKVLYGSMAGVLKTNPTIIGIDSSAYYYEVNSNVKMNVPSEEKFYLLNFGNVTGTNVYMHKSEGASTIGDYKKSSGGSIFGTFSLDPCIKNIFDWGKFNLLQTFRNVDDILTLVYIFLLNIIPRVMIMDFLMLATLSLVANYPIVQFFCTRVVDIYKVLSLGHTNVTEIDPRQIWTSTFWAMVILGMMQQESLIHLLQWFDELILAFVAR